MPVADLTLGIGARHAESTARPDPVAEELSDFDGAFDRAFSLVAFVLNRHIIDHLLRATATAD